ncbi:Hsp20/alpha crystallin family protein [Alteribacter natronophilus]|uniref:Hsp20/alpha crystallin family protein n=1 Tax=Alteribacter natronophilus TaxID=2583810 RepID=UPI00110ED74D|nr:Hsp20/alpha crystallin family protein [Alteribacter natronophilus]TMW70705.1 hypothetical protein FGB90_16110 [Alteribacter natronophilus]
MLFNLWKMFNPLQNGSFNPLQGGGLNPFQQNGQEGMDPSKMFGGQNGLPFDPKMLQDSTWVNEYVQNILKETIPGQNDSSGESGEEAGPSSSAKAFDPQGEHLPRHEVFQMHEYIIVRVFIPEEVNPDQLGVSLAHSRIVLKGLPEQDEYTIQLPEHPNEKRIGATCKDNVLEIRLRKLRTEPVIPISVRFD